jgi:hypothetical protein
MQISEMIAVLQNEVAKSYAFISETKGDISDGTSILHINVERVEIELPVMLNQQEVEYNPKNVKGLPTAYKKLAIPFIAREKTIPTKTVTGKTINAEIVGHIEKIDDRVSPESVGRIKIVFKLVVS